MEKWGQSRVSLILLLLVWLVVVVAVSVSGTLDGFTAAPEKAEG